MEQNILEKWRKIYYYTKLIVELDPWSRFEEKDVFVLKTKEKQEEHFYSFLEESCGRCAIAIYRNGQAYCKARERLHGRNTKHEPIFMLQDAVIFVLGDREDVSKHNYGIIKELGLKCRGKGAWPFFEKYSIGYAPQAIPEDELDMLQDDLGNLWMMVYMIAEGRVAVDFKNREIMARCYNPGDDTFYSYATRLTRPLTPDYNVITLNDKEWLASLRESHSKGTISMDWSYIPTVIRDEGIDIVPRLLLIIENSSGCILRCTMLPPSELPHEDLLDELLDLFDVYGKPSTIQICDKEIECYIRELCKEIKIHVEYKPQLKQLSKARKELMEMYR